MTNSAQRLDKWLVFARLCKTRGLAQKLIDRGQVTLNGSVVNKSGASVRPGDELAVVLGPVKRTLIVKGGGERRGPPAEARLLFDEPAHAEKLPRDEWGLRR
jgi:ribosome-associated heat shock protein Hsp15